MPKSAQNFNVRGSGGKISDYLPEQNAQRILQITAGGVGEVNTGSNQGTDGVGVFDTKSSVDLQFRHVAPASAKITVTLNGKDIDIDVATGTTVDTVCVGNDARLSDARTPLTHALNSHTQGSDVIFMTKGATFTEISLGAVGYVLVSGGNGADLTWETHYTQTEVDSAITTHTAIATAHQDAPGLIATHTAITNAHHAVYLDSDAVSAVSTADAYLKNNASDETTGTLTVGGLYVKNVSTIVSVFETGTTNYMRIVFDGGTWRIDYDTDGDGLYTPYTTPISISSAGVTTLASLSMSANIAMGTHKVTGLGASTTAGDAVRHEDSRLSDARTPTQHDNSYHSTNYESEFSTNNWKVFYSNGSNVVTELALGADGDVLTSTGTGTAPAFETPMSGGFESFPPAFLILRDGFTWDYDRATVIMSDVSTRISYQFICPETRSDWKISIHHYSDTASRTASGKIYLGATATGEAGPANNIYNGTNFDLVNTLANYLYTTTSAEWSATKGDYIGGSWLKDNDAGTGNLRIYAIFIWHD